MLGIHDFSLFVGTAVLLNLTPGPDTMFILGRCLSQGHKAGIASALGIGAGCLVHTVGAALGLSAILMTSALAFSLVKFAGAAYLIYLGIKMVLTKSSSLVRESQAKDRSHWIPFRQGMVTNILNPKVALFFLALLPQFVEKSATQPVLSFLILGLTFVTTGTIWSLVLVYSASFIHAYSKGNGLFTKVINRITGVVFVGLGFKLAFSERA